MKISVCIIGLDEEKNLPDCLRSVQAVADEIVYVDSFSKDKSLSIAKTFGCKIFRRKFDGYRSQKNFAAEKARNTWILNLDCDERLSPELSQAILRAKQSPDSNIVAYKFNRLTWYIYRFIRHSGWYPDDKIRLYDKRQCIWEGDTVHEIIHAPKQLTKHLQGDLLHYSFHSINDHLHTIRKYSDMASQDLFDRGRKVTYAGVLARAVWVIIRKIFFEFSFLDGAAGLTITWYSAVATYTKYVKLYMMRKHA